jgi:indolepyruvate ferredoxin oxidoreductase beta subunit
MRFDCILAGVGGQGVLSLSAVIGAAATRDGLYVTQSEVHGMAQRGGAVVSHLRISDEPIASALIPLGTASLVLSLEPLEALRYLDYLAPDGWLITASNPVENIADYPNPDALLDRIRELPHPLVVDGERLAKKAGSAKATNVVMVGAAARLLPVKPSSLDASVRELFAAKGERAVDANLRALEVGREEAR